MTANAERDDSITRALLVRATADVLSMAEIADAVRECSASVKPNEIRDIALRVLEHALAANLLDPWKVRDRKLVACNYDEAIALLHAWPEDRLPTLSDGAVWLSITNAGRAAIAGSREVR